MAFGPLDNLHIQNIKNPTAHDRLLVLDLRNASLAQRKRYPLLHQLTTLDGIIPLGTSTESAKTVFYYPFPNQPDNLFLPMMYRIGGDLPIGMLSRKQDVFELNIAPKTVRAKHKIPLVPNFKYLKGTLRQHVFACVAIAKELKKALTHGKPVYKDEEKTQALQTLKEVQKIVSQHLKEGRKIMQQTNPNRLEHKAIRKKAFWTRLLSKRFKKPNRAWMREQLKDSPKILKIRADKLRTGRT